MQLPQAYTAVFEDAQIYNEKFTHLHFELKKPFSIKFRAGQFITFKINEQGSQRAYSICSDPDIDHGVEILIDVSPQGEGIKYFQNLKMGTEVFFTGPMGRFYIEDNAQEEAIVLVGTGSGVAPLYSMVIDQLKNKEDTRPITLYWGLRQASHLVWQDELARWSKNFPNFQFHPTLSQAETEWNLCRGRVTNCLQVHDLPANAGYYLCGGKQMINDVKQLLLARGVTADKIHHEKFF
ncbi:MAG TPA: FAD-binding oxidoreductase [Candidatus Woesebacteria bacterium]|nr:FAD-binding oxidoreductase [Candidatus Woesebacteria bacterium]